MGPFDFDYGGDCGCYLTLFNYCHCHNVAVNYLTIALLVTSVEQSLIMNHLSLAQTCYTDDSDHACSVAD